MTEVSFLNPESESKTTAPNSNNLKWKKAKDQLLSANDSNIGKLPKLVESIVHSKTHDISSVKNKKSKKQNLANKIEAFESNSKTLFLDPKLNRRRLMNDYEHPVSDRESWWRSTIKETPLPGRYNLQTFVHDIIKKPNSFSFKSDGRRRDPLPQMRKGEYLLPGAYSYEDLSQRLRRVNLSYGFKNHIPVDKSKFGLENTVSPFSYDTTKYFSLTTQSEPAKHSFFKSKEKRNIFDNYQVKPKEGPAPGDYEEPKPKNIEITSAFKSDSNRFIKTETFTPGPGAYDPISAWINSKESFKFNTKGVYFTPSAKVYA